MASTDFVYATARQALNKAQINLSSVTIGAALVSSVYSPAPATDQYLSGIPSAAILEQVDLTGVAVSASGWLQGTIPQLLSFIAAVPCVALVLFVDTGNPATSQLLYYSSTGVGFPFLPSGFNYVVAYDQAAGGFFQ